MTPGDALLLELAVAALTPSGRSQNPAAMRLAWRIEKLGEPLPVGFVATSEQEVADYYHRYARQPAPHPPVAPGGTMSEEEAERIYRGWCADRG